jgi:DNA (cytosine-5)-methyltransferase 1
MTTVAGTRPSVAQSTSLKNKEDTKIFRYGELFSGPGGLALGAQRARATKNDTTYTIDHAWAVDYDRDSCETSRKNIALHDPGSVRCEDVKNLDIESLGPIDSFAYGFPCNDFSVVGEQKGFKGAFGPLYTYGLKVIDRYKPKFFVAENVGGLASANGGEALKTILKELGESGNGYCITAHRYKAEDYGVPQTRHRIIAAPSLLQSSRELKKVSILPPEDRSSLRVLANSPTTGATSSTREVCCGGGRIGQSYWIDYRNKRSRGGCGTVLACYSARGKGGHTT